MIVHGKLVSGPSGCWDNTTVQQNVLSKRTRACTNGMWCAPGEGPDKYGERPAEHLCTEMSYRADFD